MLDGFGSILSSYVQGSRVRAEAMIAANQAHRVKMQKYWLSRFRRYWCTPGTAIGVIAGSRYCGSA